MVWGKYRWESPFLAGKHSARECRMRPAQLSYTLGYINMEECSIGCKTLFMFVDLVFDACNYVQLYWGWLLLLKTFVDAWFFISDTSCNMEPITVVKNYDVIYCIHWYVGSPQRHMLLQQKKDPLDPLTKYPIPPVNMASTIKITFLFDFLSSGGTSICSTSTGSDLILVVLSLVNTISWPKIWMALQILLMIIRQFLMNIHTLLVKLASDGQPSIA